jgi:hypothetical protein
VAPAIAVLTVSNGCGVVFELTPTAGGAWTESALHGFSGGNDGAFPVAAVILNAAGNLYGTTFYGTLGGGVVFSLTPNSHGAWTETSLMAFYLEL